jgi:excisionase family DNA binding protein
MNKSALSVTKVSIELGVCRRTTLRLIESGELRAHRIGGQWRVFLSDLQDYLGATSNRPQTLAGSFMRSAETSITAGTGAAA